MRISDWSADVCSSDLFTIKRGSETVHLSIKIGTRKEADRFGNEYRIGMIGIQSPPPELRDVSLLEAPGVAVERTGTVLRLMVDTLGQILRGRRPVSELGGPLKRARVCTEASRVGKEGVSKGSFRGSQDT